MEFNINVYTLVRVSAAQGNCGISRYGQEAGIRGVCRHAHIRHGAGLTRRSGENRT